LLKRPLIIMDIHSFAGGIEFLTLMGTSKKKFSR
jgi:hypothetical protein